MNLLRSVCFSAVLALICNGASAQEFYQHDTTVRVYAYSHLMPLAWCGGFNNPQFSQADLNHDGLQDLVVFEPGLGISTLINTGMVGGMPNYKYAPKYALNFPAAYGYLQLADYNCDGIADMFDRGGDGIAVHKGYYNAANELCFDFYRSLFYYNDVLSGGAANAYVNPGDIPAVADVDGDGDLDFIAYYITGGYMYYYKNVRVEEGLPCDSIRVKLADRCWGKVYQGFYRGHSLGYTCSNAGLRPAEKVTHSGNAICLFDWDMDGDMDYLDGSVSFNEMTFLKNGRTETAYPVDTMIAQDTLWQTGGKKIELPTWPAAFNVDIDLDGKKDLLISPNSGSSSENYKCIWYYKNNSTTGTPDWQFQSDSFLIDKTIDVGTSSYPMLFDYDKDGKPDLIVGSDGYRQPSGLLRSKLSLYKNTSVTGNASFTLQSTDLLGMSALNFAGAAPAAGDINNDGRSDLIVGHTDGTLTYFKNLAASEALPPDWQVEQLTLTDGLGSVINVGGNAAPFIYDIDKDGKMDLIIGSIYGFVQYYRNVSTTPGTINLQLINLKLGGAKADPLQNFGNYSVPFIGKLDPTGVDYLLMGSNSGNVYQYTGFQTGDTTAGYTLVDGRYSFIDSTHSIYNSPGTYYGIYGNRRTSVTVGDIDGSGSYSLIKGNVRGGLEFYKRKVYQATTPILGHDGKLIVYPNPARDMLNVSWSGTDTDIVTITLVDVTGRHYSEKDVPSRYAHYSMPVGDLPSGLYVCILQSGNHRYYSKFTVIR
jgi:hypothetical protein